jgi:hypothetical protein
VGIGEQVYVAAAVGSKTGVTAYDWSLSTKPTGSVAAIVDAKQAGKTFTPDVAGDYVVTLKMTHSKGDTTMTQTITASSYVGADKCGQCHPTVKETWSKTNHASALARKISGFQTNHFGSACVKCHAVSSNTSNLNAPLADNGSFWSVASKLGWTFPTNLTQGTWTPVTTGQTPSADAYTNGAWSIDLKGGVWETMPAELKALGNIQCESCHGPGSAHASGGFAGADGAKKIGISLDNGVCAKCHDDGHYHVRPEEWANSVHGLVWTRDTNTCAPCHLGSGRLASIEQGVDLLAGGVPKAGSFELGVTQTCATCHSPHSVANDKQLRWKGTVQLKAIVPGTTGLSNFTTNDMGIGATCAQCHHLRPGADVPGKSPHHSHQTEMLQGVGGYHFPNESYISGSHKFMENACVTCHMPVYGSSDKRAGHVGGHTWRMSSDNGTPTDPSDDLHSTQGCVACHGPLQNFDVNGAQSEIETQLKVLSDVLPHQASAATEVAFLSVGGGRGSASRVMTETEINAAWNYGMVSYDGSSGAHNFKYARKLLSDALVALKAAPTSTLVGDFNGDKKVDFTDLFMFTANFGKSKASAEYEAKYDLSGNEVVGFTDWLIFLDSFGKSAASGKPVLVNNGRNAGADFVLIGSNRASIDQDHIAVQLQAVNMTEMRGYGVYVTYDPNVLEFVRAVRAEDNMLPKSETALTVQSLETGRLLIADATVGNQTVVGSGPLADLIFRRIGAAGQSSVQIDLAQIADLNFGLNMPGAPAQEVKAATVYGLNQNYPNPFNPATTIQYSLAEPGDVKIVVYNALGQEVRTLVSNYKLSGDYSAQWDARDSAGREVASGVYVYRMEVNGFVQTHRMVLMR